MCGHTRAEHDARKTSSQWPKQKLVGIQELPGHTSLELRNCEDHGTMAKPVSELPLWEYLLVRASLALLGNIQGRSHSRRRGRWRRRWREDVNLREAACAVRRLSGTDEAVQYIILRTGAAVEKP